VHPAIESKKIAEQTNNKKSLVFMFPALLVGKYWFCCVI
jgi:hypothetical protein